MIAVDFSKRNAQYILIVSDNGVGLPSGFNQRGLHSMGYQLIEDFTRKLKGDSSDLGFTTLKNRVLM